MENLEKQLNDLLVEQGKIIAKLDESKGFGEEVKGLRGQFDALQKQIDALDLKIQANQKPGGETAKSFDEELKENESLQRLMKDRRGSASFTISGQRAMELLSRKTLITSSDVGFPTSGVMPEERLPFVPEARRTLRLRSVIPSRQTNLGKVYFPKVNVGMTKASPVAEGNEKPENRQTYTVVSEDIKTIATVIPASRQVLDDWSELGAILRDSLAYEVLKEEDLQILTGDNTGENLNGLVTQAQAFDISLLTASLGYTFIDIISAGIQQIAEDDEDEPTFVIVHPRDLWKIKRTKDDDKRYILGDPNSPFLSSVWGLNIVTTTAITSGKFLVGRGVSNAAEILDRMGLEVAISTEHDDFFVKNKVMIRAEKRMALLVKRPNCFVYGDLTTSPA